MPDPRSDRRPTTDNQHPVKPLIGIGADVGVTGGAPRERAFAYVTYIDAVRKAGAIPVLVPPQPENLAELVGGLDGVLLPGGADCDPAAYGAACDPTIQLMDSRRQANDLALASAARTEGVPALGICLGVQIMNIAAGGTLIQDIAKAVDTPIRHESEPTARVRHGVVVTSGTRLASIVGDGPLDVNSSHHQAADRIGRGLVVSAKAPDGIVEGLEDPQHPFYVGVQWHPEDMNGESSAASIFSAFIDAARKRAESRRGGAERNSMHSGVVSRTGRQE